MNNVRGQVNFMISLQLMPPVHAATAICPQTDTTHSSPLTDAALGKDESIATRPEAVQNYGSWAIHFSEAFAPKVLCEIKT